MKGKLFVILYPLNPAFRQVSICSSFLLMTLVCSVGCHREIDAKHKGIVVEEIPNVASKPVRIYQLERSDFEQMIFSNGKIHAHQKANLTLPTQGLIVEVAVKNGEIVKKGQVLARITDSTLFYEKRRIAIKIEKALIEQQSQLLGLGHNLDAIEDVPHQNLKITSINSGLSALKNELKLINHKIKNTTIRAPFDGMVANLKAMKHNSTSEFPYFCTLIDEKKFFVLFKIMESEFLRLWKGQSLIVNPMSFEAMPIKAKVTAINPIVENAGLIQVEAQVNEKASWLIDGLNVSIKLLHKVSNKLILPKTAILHRQHKSLVFIYENGRAKWNYVKTGLENENCIIVNEGLHEGQKVIVDGNIDLVHDDKVSIDTSFIEINN